MLRHSGVRTLCDLASVSANEQGVLSIKAFKLWDLLEIFHGHLSGALSQLFQAEGLPFGTQSAFSDVVP